MLWILGPGSGLGQGRIQGRAVEKIKRKKGKVRRRKKD